MAASREDSLILTRESFDPIFTDEFFKKAKEKEEKIEPIGFPIPEGETDEKFAATLKGFLESPDGIQFKTGVGVIVDEIKNTILNWATDEDQRQAWFDNLDRFYQKRFRDYTGSNQPYNKKLRSLYIDGVIALNNLLQKIKDDAIPLVLRQSIIRNLLDSGELERCGPGTAGFIRDSYMHLVANPSEALAAARHQIAMQVANVTHKELDSNAEDHAPGMEVHYARFFVRSYGHVLGVEEIWDIYFENLDPEKVEALFAACVKTFPSALTLENVVSQLVKKFDLVAIVEDLENKLNTFKQETDDPTLLFTSYYELQTAKLKDLLDKYGLDEDWVVGSFFELEYTEEGSMKVSLQPDAQKSLEISLINRLFAQGYLNQNQRIEIPILSGDNLFLLLGENNVGLSYIKSKKNRKHMGFSAYYEEINEAQKREVIEILIKKAKESPPEQRESIVKLALKSENFYLQCLKEKIIDPTTKNKDGLTPIMFAAKKGYLNVVQYLASEIKETLNQTYEANGSKLIHFAAEGGQIEVIKYLVNECGALIDAPNNNGNTPLWFAAHKGHIEAVKYLISMGAVPDEEVKLLLITLAEKDSNLYLKWLQEKIIDPTTKNKDGLTPIMFAAQKGYLNVVQYLAREAKETLQQIYEANGSKPIHFAAQGGQVEVIKYLVTECGALLDEPNNNGETPLWFAARAGQIDAVKYLIAMGAVPDEKIKLLLITLAEKDSNLYLKWLQEKIIDPTTQNKDGLTPIMFAAQKGYLNVVQYLASEFPVTLDQTYGYKPIHYAAAGGQVEVIKYLVNECGALIDEPDKNGKTPLWFAAKNGQIDAVKYLIAMGAVPDEKIKLLLITLAEKDSNLYLKWLQEKIIDPTTQNKDGLTPIMFAAQKGYLNVVQYLASEFPVTLDQTYETGSKPIHFAAQGGHAEVIKYLVTECGALVNEPNKGGQTPLWYATLNGNIHAVKELVERGANVNLPNKKNEIPLMSAARKGYLEIVKYLIEKGAAVNQISNEGKTAVSVALSNEQFGVADVLLVSGGKVPNNYKKLACVANNTPLKDKLAAFACIPESNQDEKKSLRESYLRDIRKRTLIIYQEKNNLQPERNALKQELIEFNQLDKWIQKFKAIINKKPRQKNEDLPANIALINTAIEEAYNLFIEKQTAKDAVNYLKIKCEAIVKNSAAFATRIESSAFSFSFLTKPTFKDGFERVFSEIEKQYPSMRKMSKHHP